MFEGIHDGHSCLVMPHPQKGDNYPPPVFITYCIYRAIYQNHICASPYTPVVQHLAVILFMTSTHSIKTINYFYRRATP